MSFSMASRQFAAFHQPVVSYSPLPLYHCWRMAAAAAVFALKSSPASARLEDPPLRAKMAAVLLGLPEAQLSAILVTATVGWVSEISTPYRRGLPLFRKLTVLL